MISDDEFLRTNPWLITQIDVFSVDHPADQPSYVGVMLKCTSKYRPERTVTFTFKLPHQMAGPPGAALSLLAD